MAAKHTKAQKPIVDLHCWPCVVFPFCGAQAVGGVIVAFPLFVLAVYLTSNSYLLTMIADKVQQSVKAKSLSEVRDSIQTKYNEDYKRINNGENLKVTQEELLEKISLSDYWVTFFIFCSTADIISDAVYAGITDFINPAMEFVVVLFLLLPIIVLFVQHQVRMGEAWLKTKGGDDRENVRRVLESDWRVPLMPLIMVASVSCFWVVLSYRFAIILGRIFVKLAFTFIKDWCVHHPQPSPRTIIDVCVWFRPPGAPRSALELEVFRPPAPLSNPCVGGCILTTRYGKTAGENFVRRLSMQTNVLSSKEKDDQGDEEGDDGIIRRAQSGVVKRTHRTAPAYRALRFAAFSTRSYCRKGSCPQLPNARQEN